MHRSIAATFCVLFGLCSAARGAEVPDDSRILRTFDFEERRLGNAEDLPMHWAKVQGKGQPHYVNGRLTTDAARGGHYSFRLDLNGGSLVYRYDPGLIAIRSDAHYRVEAYCRTTALPNARARLTAYFVDADLRPLPDTIARSPLYASRGGGDDWHKLAVQLTATDPAARYLVIELGLLQPELYAANSLGQRTLYAQDIRGTAWFDDVSVSQVPQVTMSTDRPGNLFRRGDVPRLTVLVNDRATEDLAAQLVIRDAAGQTVFRRSGALDMTAAETLGPGRKRMGVPLPGDLPAGWYEAALVMTSRGQYVGEQTLSFIRLADDAGADGYQTPDPRFGITATDLPFEGWGELPQILPFLGAGRIKLAVWSGAGDVQQVNPDAFDHLLEKLGQLGITPTACLLDLPPSILDKLSMLDADRANRLTSDADAGAVRVVQREDGESIAAGAGRSNWARIATADRELWQPQLAYLLARHATHLDRWQLGADGSDEFVTVPAMRGVYHAVYREFAALIQSPDLAMPWPAWYELDGQMPATVALSVPPSVLPSQLPLYMADLGGKRSNVEVTASTASPARHSTSPLPRSPTLSLSLQLLDRDTYGRELQIQDLAQRVVYALSAGAERIDVPLPFTVGRDAEGGVTRNPQEMLMIVRTLITTLGGTTFKGKVPIAEGFDAFLFDKRGQGILVLWDKGDGRGVKQLDVNLGERPLRMDLWGNVTPLIAARRTLASAAAGSTDTTGDAALRGGAFALADPSTAARGNAATTSPEPQGVPLSVGPMPTFLIGVDGPLAQMRASVAIDRPLLESSFEPHVRRIRFSNPYKQAIGGQLKLRAPQGWTLNPPTFTFTLNPGETFERDLTIEFPYNTFAGRKMLAAEFQVQADRNNSFTVPVQLNLGL
ncbi:MAG TPA: NEW3 domain-containing protein, partial [Tepidisphaeraceae bacterium]|nr:NEW3 domain-containing protein [Tepidisphaeraceae bacterium]